MRRPAEPARRPDPRTTLAATLVATLVAGTLGGCASRQPPEPPAAPTLKQLAGREAALPAAVKVDTSPSRAMAAYQAALADPLKPEQRAEALRRLGDLEMDHIDLQLSGPEPAAGAASASEPAAATAAASASASASAAAPAGSTRPAAAAGSAPGSVAPPDYREAIQRYRRYLAGYPTAPGNDAVLYQLARALDLNGEPQASLQVLDQLVKDFPQTRYLDEAHFRRGEMLFTQRQYAAAERAYALVLEGGRNSPFRERAHYMRGWSQFKLARLDEALDSFLTVLDGQLAQHRDDVPLDELPGMSRTDRELVDDTMRVTSLCLESLQGAQTLAEHVQTEQRQRYEVRLYQHLSALYLRQDRPKDAADTLDAFIQRHPLHAQAPALLTQVIGIHTTAGFDSLVLAAKKDYVQRYLAGGAYQQAQPEAWARTQPQVREHLVTLARHHHALAQQQRRPEDVAAAVQWYGTLLSAFPEDAQAPEHRFLLAELLYEHQRWAEAITAYEAVAYAEPAHARSNEAGYAALLAHNERVKAAPEAERAELRRASMASSLKFAERFPQDARSPGVLAHVADTRYQLGDAPGAVQAADQLLARYPDAPAAARRTVWLVKAHSAFESGAFALAEPAYVAALALIPEKDTSRATFTERLAVSVYRQGEQARDAGDFTAAAGHFERVASVVPGSPVRVNAQFDAAAARLSLKDWAGATRLLEDFRQRYPRHELTAQIPARLAVAYTEQQRWPQAAAEYERIATSTADPDIARTAWWEVAVLHEKAANRPAATRAWENYLKRYPAPPGAAIEAREHLRQLAAAEGNTKREMALQREILQADQAAGDGRTARTRELGARAALAVAAPMLASYREVKLVEPLAKSLKLKKERMQAVLSAYTLAANYGAPEVATAATYQIATVYQDFAKALMSSQRPKKLSALELEQYDLMLEEQADPFNTQATELHESNTARTTQGVFDDWIKQSFAALRELRPARYRKAERSEEVIDAIR